jgi:hypothetical protein
VKLAPKANRMLENAIMTCPWVLPCRWVGQFAEPSREIRDKNGTLVVKLEMIGGLVLFAAFINRLRENDAATNRVITIGCNRRSEQLLAYLFPDRPIGVHSDHFVARSAYLRGALPSAPAP